MIQFEELVPSVGFFTQMGEESAEPVVLCNIFKVEPDKIDAFLTAWQADATFFKAQPGMLSAQMHRGTCGSPVFLNYVVWESLAAFRKAFQNPEVQAKISAYPAGTVVIPQLYRKIAIPGICVA